MPIFLALNCSTVRRSDFLGAGRGGEGRGVQGSGPFSKAIKLQFKVAFSFQLHFWRAFPRVRLHQAGQLNVECSGRGVRVCPTLALSLVRCMTRSNQRRGQAHVQCARWVGGCKGLCRREGWGAPLERVRSPVRAGEGSSPRVEQALVWAVADRHT